MAFSCLSAATSPSIAPRIAAQLFFFDCETRQTSINDTFLSYPANGVRCASSSRSANWLSSWSLRTDPAPSREQSEISHPP